MEVNLSHVSGDIAANDKSEDLAWGPYLVERSDSEQGFRWTRTGRDEGWEIFQIRDWG